MYENYWQLTRKPFDNTSDPKFYYPSDAHQGALLKLRYAIENRRGGAVVSGAAGLGKSLLVNALFRQLPDRFQPRVHMVFPQMSTDELLAYLAEEFSGQSGTSAAPRSSDSSIRCIQEALRENTEAGRHAVLAIDEAHLLQEMGTLDTMRLILNFEFESQPAVTLLLIGQPSLLANLDRMPGLEERLGVKCLLRPFTEDETVSYVSHRLTAAGANEMIFDQDALEAIHALSLGVPRRINRLADLALLIGFAEERTSVTAEQIEAVSEELVTVKPE